MEEYIVADNKDVKDEIKDEEVAAEEVANETEAAEEVKSEETKSEETKSEGTEKAPKSKKFSKKEKKDKKDEKIEELNDRLMRLMAEYDNYRKRTEKEKSSMFEMGAKSIVERVIPVIDNFERGLMTVEEKDKEDPFVTGMEKIYTQFVTTMEEAGVTPIEAVDKEFDPNLHNAVMHVDDEAYGENVVVEELQKGYMYKDSVVRYSMVKVAN